MEPPPAGRMQQHSQQHSQPQQQQHSGETTAERLRRQNGAPLTPPGHFSASASHPADPYDRRSASPATRPPQQAQHAQGSASSVASTTPPEFALPFEPALPGRLLHGRMVHGDGVGSVGGAGGAGGLGAGAAQSASLDPHSSSLRSHLNNSSAAQATPPLMAYARSRQTYILDTSVLLHDPDVLCSFDDSTVCVPLCVVDDLDHFKKAGGAVGANARAAIRQLDALRAQGDLSQGVVNAATGGLVRILTHSSGLSDEGDRLLPQAPAQERSSTTSGDRVLRFALSMSKAARRLGDQGKVVLVSKDMVVRLKANAFGLEVADFVKQAVHSDSDMQGYIELEVEPHVVDAVQAQTAPVVVATAASAVENIPEVDSTPPDSPPSITPTAATAQPPSVSPHAIPKPRLTAATLDALHAANANANNASSSHLASPPHTHGEGDNEDHGDLDVVDLLPHASSTPGPSPHAERLAAAAGYIPTPAHDVDSHVVSSTSNGSLADLDDAAVAASAAAAASAEDKDSHASGEVRGECGLTAEEEHQLRVHAGDRLVANTFVVLRDRTAPARCALLRVVPQPIEYERPATATTASGTGNNPTDTESSSGRDEQQHAARFRRYSTQLKAMPILRMCWNVFSRAIQQAMAMELLMDPSVSLVTLVGQAGTGKTLIALAAGLEQTIVLKRYKKVLVTRPIVALGADIGYLPGSKEDKMMHWMQPIFDNLAFMTHVAEENSALAAANAANAASAANVDSNTTNQAYKANNTFAALRDDDEGNASSTEAAANAHQTAQSSSLSGDRQRTTSGSEDGHAHRRRHGPRRRGQADPPSDKPVPPSPGRVQRHYRAMGYAAGGAAAPIVSAATAAVVASRTASIGGELGGGDANADGFADGVPGAYIAKASTQQLIHEKVQMEAITYLRGRSIQDEYVVVDECQNLTPHEVKTIISRAGEGTKIVLCGDPLQIDNPYLDATTNGLTYVVDRLRGISMYGQITLKTTMRSSLAAVAAELL